MRVPSPRLIRLGSLSRGVQVDSGDAEVVVPGILQPTIELSSPIDKVVVAGGTFNDSVFTGLVVNRIGAQAAASTGVLIVDRGAWSFDLTVQASFSGTSNLALGNPDELLLADPDGAAFPLFHLPRITGVSMTWAQTFRF